LTDVTHDGRGRDSRSLQVVPGSLELAGVSGAENDLSALTADLSR
jgi:hypothetical protein